MAVSGRICFAFLISAALGPALAAQVQEPTEVVPLSEQGRLLAPLLTEDEQLAWEALPNDEARSDFVRAFWAERDPTPGTATNERREIFRTRARRTIAQFAEGATPGYATDRGRVMLVYGLPDELELRAVPAGSAPTLTWIYRRHVPAVTVLFAQDGEEFRLEEEPELSDYKFMRGLGDDLRLQLATAVGDRHGALRRPGSPKTAAELAAPDSEPPDEQNDEPVGDDDGAVDTEPVVVAGPVLPPAPEVAPEVKIWLEMVFSGVERKEIELRRRLYFFPASEGTYTALTFEVERAGLEFVVPEIEEATETESAEPPGKDEAVSARPLTAAESAAAHLEEFGEQEPDEARADLRVFGAFLQGEPGAENTMHSFIIPYELAESAGDFASSPALSLGVTLFPGTYRLVWGVLDTTTGRAVTRDETVEVPDYGQGTLRLTQPLLAAGEIRDDTRPMNTTTIYQGIRLGNLLVANDLDDVFDRDATVEIVALVTGWASDPAAPGKPRLEVVYRILDGLEGEESLARLPAQVLDFHVLGQQIPLGQVKRLQAGHSYRIEVRVKDLVGGGETVQRAPIHLRREPGGDRQEETR